MSYYEYIDIKKYAKRMGNISLGLAREDFRSKNIRPFVRQKNVGCKLLINWTKFQD